MAENVNKDIFLFEMAKTNVHLQVKVLKNRVLFPIITKSIKARYR